MEQEIKTMNKLMVIGTVVNAVITLLTLGSDPSEMPLVLNFILLSFLAINIIGIILSNFMKGKIGPLLVMIGSIAFIPIGAIAIMGARKALDGMKIEKLNLES